MCCIIYGLRHDAIVIDCSALRFGTRWSEVFAITTMESRKVNGKIFISGPVVIRTCGTGRRLATPISFELRPPRIPVTRFAEEASPCLFPFSKAADGSGPASSFQACFLVVCPSNAEALIQTRSNLSSNFARYSRLNGRMREGLPFGVRKG